MSLLYTLPEIPREAARLDAMRAPACDYCSEPLLVECSDGGVFVTHGDWDFFMRDTEHSPRLRLRAWLSAMHREANPDIDYEDALVYLVGSLCTP